MPAERTHKVSVESNVPAKMRDGTILRADVYRPDARGPLPVLLCRTPYGKNFREMHVEIAHGLAERGYIVVYQDIRGRYDSEGEFGVIRDPSSEPDASDGYDTVEWCAALPGSSGRVGMFGNS